MRLTKLPKSWKKKQKKKPSAIFVEFKFWFKVATGDLSTGSISNTFSHNKCKSLFSSWSFCRILVIWTMHSNKTTCVTLGIPFCSPEISDTYTCTGQDWFQVIDPPLKNQCRVRKMYDVGDFVCLDFAGAAF